MKITDLLNIKSIAINPKVNSKNEAIDKLVDLMDASGNLVDKNEYKKAVLAREELSTTGIGDGIAIPHAGISDGVFRTDFSFLILEKTVKFGDKKEANFFFIFSSTNKEEHIEILNDFYNIILNKDFINKIPKINNYNILKKYIKEGGDCYNV